MRSFWPLLALLVLTPASALAQKKAAAEAGAEAGDIKPKDGGVRRDPAGQTGISPYMEAIAKGERAYAARDFVGAVEGFQDAIKLDPERMLGFYRLGEAELARNKLGEAEAAWQTALGKKGTKELEAKVLFCKADLLERQRKLPEAKEAWERYAKHLQDNAGIVGYAATAAERSKAIERRQKDEKDYGEVKARIQKRQEEQEKEALENAKKDKLNK